MPTPLKTLGYSARASRGLMRVARRAGSPQATSATPKRTRVTPAMTRGSAEWTPNNWASRLDLRKKAPAAPEAKGQRDSFK